MNCHHASKPRVGPPYKAIAAKRCADPVANQERMAARLRDGTGHPKAALSEAELQQIVEWICSIKPD